MPEHLFNLQMHLEHYEYLQKMVEVYEQKIIQRLEELSPPERQQQPVPVHPNPTKEKNIKRQLVRTPVESSKRKLPAVP